MKIPRINPLLRVAGLALWIMVALPAAAHSLKDVEEALQEREHYAQIVHEAAPPFSLEDTDSRAWNLDDFKGKAVVLNFVYARCQDVCPLHMHLIAELQDMVNSAGMTDVVQFITVATDTEDAQETAEVMNSYQARHGLDPINWLFLYRGSGSPDAGIQLAERYGLKFSITEEGTQMHGLVTHVIDREGQLRARFHGLNFKPINLVNFVNALAYDDHSETAAVSGFQENRLETSGSNPQRLPLIGWAMLGAGTGGLMTVAFLGYRRLWRPLK